MGGRHAEPQTDGDFTFIQERFKARAPVGTALILLSNCGHEMSLRPGDGRRSREGKVGKCCPKPGLKGEGKEGRRGR